MRDAGGPPRFVADVMLGRLARWLRVLGCDVAWGPHLHGAPLVRLARDEDRIVLTRESRVLRDPPPRLLRLTSDGFREQLAQVVAAFPSARGAAFSRCLRCNVVLEHDAPRAGGVAVQRCPRCRRSFWAGPHRSRMERVLTELRVAHG